MTKKLAIKKANIILKKVEKSAFNIGILTFKNIEDIIFDILPALIRKNGKI